MIVGRPEPDGREQHLCLDKGHDNPSGRGVAEAEAYVPHIRRTREEKLDAATKKQKRHPARR